MTVKKRSFKIHANEVRKAAKKMKLNIEQCLTLESWDDEGADDGEYLGASCPIGAIYAAEHDDREADPTDVFMWANQVYGKNYVNGFVAGFDEAEPLKERDLEWMPKQDKPEYVRGHENGCRLAKFLLS